MKGQPLYGRLGRLPPFPTAGFDETDLPQIPRKRVCRNLHFEPPQTFQYKPLRRARLQFGLDNFPIFFQQGKLRSQRSLFLVNDAAKGCGGLGVVREHGRILNGREILIKRLSDIYRINVGQTSYAKRKTMVSWIKNGWGSAWAGSGLNRGFAP